jgi:hypothetical protein
MNLYRLICELWRFFVFKNKIEKREIMKKKSYKHLLLILAAAMSIMVPTAVCAWPVPDMGLTKCYSDSAEIPCPQPGEPFYGQDAQYGPNLQSFSDLGNGVIRDNVTGLEWQQNTESGMTWYDAVTYCENLICHNYQIMTV